MTNQSPNQPNKKVRAASAGGGPSGSMVWIVLVVVVGVIGIIAVVLARGAGDDSATGTNSGATGDGTPAQETAAVTVVDPASGGTGEGELLIAGGLPLTVDDGADPAVGMTIPTLEGTTVDGESITIGADGRPKVLVFMAHWCPHCQKEIPRLADHFADAGMPDDVDIVGVSTRVEAEATNYPPSRWLEREDWTVPTLVDSTDSTAWAMFGAGGFPYFVVVDADGTVVARTSGELGTDAFDQLVDAARTGA